MSEFALHLHDVFRRFGAFEILQSILEPSANVREMIRSVSIPISFAVCRLWDTARIALPVFVIWQLSERNPVLDLRLFGKRNYAIATFCSPISFTYHPAAPPATNSRWPGCLSTSAAISMLLVITIRSRMPASRRARDSSSTCSP